MKFQCVAESRCTHLDYVQLWQQVAVGQGHLVAVQEVACGHLDVLDAVVVDLVGEGRAQVFVQLLQRFQESTLQSCTRTMRIYCCANTPIHHKRAAWDDKPSLAFLTKERAIKSGLCGRGGFSLTGRQHSVIFKHLDIKLMQIIVEIRLDHVDRFTISET